MHQAIAELAEHLRRYDEHSLAGLVEGTLAGVPERLAQRVLTLLARGSGGIKDSPLYSGGEIDRAATRRRDELADGLFEKARASLR